jgi:tripartite-type tricarboxylate transporter receptor subunit TctC
MKKIKLAITVALLGGLAWVGPSVAAFPDKPIRLIVPYPAGGGGDRMARAMGLRLGAELGQQIVIENRGGAGGALAAETVARATPDGYTMLFGTVGTQAINPAIYPTLRYDPLKDFAPISQTHIAPRVLMVKAALPVKNIAELTALAKKQPGVLSYGSAGSGSTGHLSGALFESMAGVDMLHVPYRGSAPVVLDLLAGRLDMTFDSITAYEEHIKSGKVRVLGVTSKARMSIWPQTPTLSESGLAGFEVSNWLGVLAPAGTPKDVLATLHAALGRAMSTPALKEELLALGIEPTFNSPAEFDALIRAELVKWAQLVKKSGATAN